MEKLPKNSSEFNHTDLQYFFRKVYELAPEELESKALKARKEEIGDTSWYRVSYYHENGQVDIQIPKMFDLMDGDNVLFSDELSVTVTTFELMIGNIVPATERRYSLYLQSSNPNFDADYKLSTVMYDSVQDKKIPNVQLSIDELIRNYQYEDRTFDQLKLEEVLFVLDSINPNNLKD